MDYMTLKEASEKWGVSSRQVNYYCVWAYSWRCENGYNLAYTEKHRKAAG